MVALFVFGPAQMFLNGSLCSNSSVIHARQPKHFAALHSRATRENVMNRIVLKTWPSVSTPVIFGGGITIENGGFDDFAFATKSRSSTHRRYHFGSTKFGSYLLGSSAIAINHPKAWLVCK